jgi:ABC-2 type transport system permease protein
VNINLFKKYFFANLKANSEFRLSFIFSNLALIFTQTLFIGSTIYLAYKFEGIGSLTYEQILLSITIIHFSYTIGLNFFSGVAILQKIIINGELDRLLLKPISLFEHILIYKVNPFFIAEILFLFILILLNPVSNYIFLLFAIPGAILMILNLYTLGLIPMFIDMNREIRIFDLYLQFGFYPPEVYFDVLQKIAFFIVPGAMVGFGAMYAIYDFNWLLIYIIYFLFSIFIFLFLSELGIKKYRSAGY